MNGIWYTTRNWVSWPTPLTLIKSNSMSEQMEILSELVDGQVADFFAMLSEKQQLTTRDGKTYWRVTFRDANREVNFPIWADASLATQCKDDWAAGEFYKIRAMLQETNYGLQLDIRRIRPVEEADRDDGFDPAMCMPSTRFDPQEMFDELVQIATEQIEEEALTQLVVHILESNHAALLTLPAAKRNHHACCGGYLEHVLNVTRTCCHFAKKYSELYPEMNPPLATDVVIAGAILHDIGKLRELADLPTGAEYTASGNLIGHILQGRDIVRESASDFDVLPDTLLRLEHVIVAHQRLPEWGSPKSPMTPEALMVHHADDLDAKLQMMVAAIAEDTTPGPMTSRQNALHQQVYRGESEA